MHKCFKESGLKYFFLFVIGLGENKHKISFKKNETTSSTVTWIFLPAEMLGVTNYIFLLEPLLINRSLKEKLLAVLTNYVQFQRQNSSSDVETFGLFPLGT